MPKFLVSATEQVYYEFEVEAESYDAAYKKVFDFGVSEDDITDSDHFEILDIEEVECKQENAVES